MADYFIADTHFGDNRIISLENRKFKDVVTHDKQLVKNWNDTVTQDDTVYVLGDFTTYKNEYGVRNLINSLNGNKVLVMGNHDDIFTTDTWKNLGFNLVIPYPIIYKNFFILSHEPMYVNENGAYANIYGHVHGNPNYKDYSNLGACVCVERIGYTPISFEKLVQNMRES